MDFLAVPLRLSVLKGWHSQIEILASSRPRYKSALTAVLSFIVGLVFGKYLSLNMFDLCPIVEAFSHLGNSVNDSQRFAIAHGFLRKRGRLTPATANLLDNKISSPSLCATYANTRLQRNRSPSRHFYRSQAFSHLRCNVLPQSWRTNRPQGATRLYVNSYSRFGYNGRVSTTGISSNFLENNAIHRGARK